MAKKIIKKQAKTVKSTVQKKVLKPIKTQSKAKQIDKKKAQQIKAVAKRALSQRLAKNTTAIKKKGPKIPQKQQISKQIRKPKTDQKKLKTISQQNLPKKAQAKKVLKIVKKAQPKKIGQALNGVPRAAKKLKVLDPVKQARIQEKLRLQANRKALRDSKMAAKIEQAKKFEIKPREDLQNIEENFILTCPQKVQDFNPKKGKLQVQPQRIFEMSNCCIFCSNRELIQCVKYNDVEGFKTLLNSHNTISNPFQRYSLNCQEDIWKAACESENDAFLKMILDYQDEAESKGIKRVKLPNVSLEKMGTGQANKLQFYFPIRQVQLSRGGKEGNNAFTHDEKMRKCNSLEIESALKYNLSLTKLEIIQTFNWKDKPAFLYSPQQINMQLGKIIRTGNFALIKYIINKCGTDAYSYGVNKMHTSAIFQGDEAKSIKQITRSKLQKKALDLSQLTPMHIAAVNPDSTVFKQFFKFYPQSSVFDLKQRDLVHYAAANESPDVLQVLLSRKCEINSQDNKGTTPLMIACKLGRIQNVKLLIEEQNRVIMSLDNQDEDYQLTLTHNTITNTQSQKKYSPLHYASQYGHTQIVKALVEEGNANFDLKTSKQKTALTLACENGHLEIVKYLVSKSANIHGMDNQGKSPLIAAVINGHLHIVSYLLRYGVNPNYRDVSDNSILHYACAYGWSHIVKYLVEQAGSDPNCQNEWKMQPILLAMLKGHFGIVDYLINLKQINASFQDDQGRTLISQLMMNINEDSMKNLKFLLEKSRIDATLPDHQGMTPLHHLANNDLYSIASELLKEKDDKSSKPRFIMRRGKKVRAPDRSRRRYHLNNDVIPEYSGYYGNQEDQKEFDIKFMELEKQTIDCTAYLLKQGAKLNQQTNLGDMTAAFLAIFNKNYSLAKWILDKDPNAIQGQLQTQKQNILHILANSFYQSQQDILDCFLNTDPKIIQELVYQRDSSGFQPFQLYIYHINISKGLNPEGKGEVVKKFLREVLLPRVTQRVIKAAQIYSENFNYDLSTYIGMNQARLDKLDILKKNKLITDDLYYKVKDMKYDMNEARIQKNLNISGNSFDKYQQDFSIIDYFENDTRKTKMGIQNVQVAKNFTPPYRYNPKLMQRQYDYNKINDEIQTYEFDIYNFYSEAQTRRTVMHYLVDYFKGFNTEEDENFALQMAQGFIESQIKWQKKNHISKSAEGFNRQDRKNMTPMNAAARYGLVSLLKVFLKAGIIDFKSQGFKTGLSFFHYISHIKDKDFINQLLACSVKKEILNLKDKNGNTALHYAAYYRNEYLVQQLLKMTNVNSQNKFGYTPLHMSLQSFNESQDHTPQIERLLLEAKADVNLNDLDGRTPIFSLFFKTEIEQAKIKDDPANLVILLTQTGMIKNLNHQDVYGNTVLHYACIKGSTISALTLINSGVDITLENKFGNTPFNLSLLFNHQDLSTFLIQNGAKVNQKVVQLKQDLNQEKDPIKKSISQLVLTESYVEQMWKNDKDKKYKNYNDYVKDQFDIKELHPFYFALKNNHNGMSYLLLSKQADMFQVLKACLQNEKIQKFKDLLIYSADIKSIKGAKDQKGRNLLMLFVKYSNGAFDQEKIDVFQLLVKEGYCDINQLDNRSQNILHHCKRDSQKFQAIYDLIKSQKQVIERMFHQIEFKHKATPLTSLFLKMPFKLENLDLLDQFFNCQVKKTDLNYINWKEDSYQQKESDQKLSYINPDYHFGQSVILEAKQNNILFKLVKQIQTQYQNTNLPEDLLFNIGRLNTIASKSLNYPNIYRRFVIYTILQLNTVKPFLDNSELFKSKPNYEKIASSFFKTNLSGIKDEKGRNLLILSLISNDYGIQQNIQLINDLLNANISPYEKDNSGNDALAYVKGNDLIMKLIKLNNPNQPEYSLGDLPTNSPLGLIQLSNEIIQKSDSSILQYDGRQKISSSFPEFNFQADSEEYLKKLRAKFIDNKMHIDQRDGDLSDDEQNGKFKDYINKPDKVGKFENCEIIRDETQNGKLFDVAMTKVDVKKGFFGIFNFYIIQLIKDTKKDMFILWTRWGRIGAEGQYQRTPFQSLEDGVKEFKKVYRQKTACKWEEFEQGYVPQPGKYKIKRMGGFIIHVKRLGKFNTEIINSLAQFQQSDWLVDYTKLKCAKSTLTETKQSFIKPLVEQATILRQMTEQLVKKELFLECLLDREVLEEIQKILGKIGYYIGLKMKFQKDRNFEEFSKVLQKINNLSNKYYDLVNPVQYATMSFNSIEHAYHLEIENKKIQLIYEMEIVTKLLFAATQKASVMHPLDYCFNQFKVKLVSLKEESDDEFKLILRYINQSCFSKQNYGGQQKHLDTNAVQSIFKVLPQDHEKNFCVGDYFDSSIHEKDPKFKNLHNHYMLFHGTRNANVLSILGQGLQIQPSNSCQINGQSFGRAIYLADKATKSILYCEHEKDDFYLLIVEAALGNVLNSIGEGFQSNELEGYHSLRVMGSFGPDFNQNIVRKDGTIWPIGKVINYPKPMIRYRQKEFKTINEMCDFQTQQLNERLEKEKQEKMEVDQNIVKEAQISPNKNVNPRTKRGGLQNKKQNQQKQQQQVDSDVEMIDTSTKRQTEEVKREDDSKNQQQEQDLVAKIQKEQKFKDQSRDLTKAYHKIEPNIIQYRECQYDWQMRQPNFYSLNDTEYLIYDPNQIRVRYVVHIKTKPVSQKAKDLLENDPEESEDDIQ